MRRYLRAVLTGTATLAILGGAARSAEAQPACTTPKTTCSGNAGYYASTEDVDRLTAVADPLLRELRTCLDAASAKHVTPVLIMRWDSDGHPVDAKVDAPGYESLPCVAKASAKLATLQNPRETSIRCEYGCAKPALPAPAKAPVVVPPTAPTTGAPPNTTTAPPAVHNTPPPQYVKTWYGWQTLLVDAVSVGLFGAGLSSAETTLTRVGYGTFVLGTPIVHFAHGNVGPGFGSFAIRLLLPLVMIGAGAITGLIVGSSGGSGSLDKFGSGASGALTGAVVGFLLGVGGCIAIDAAGLAYDKEKVDPATTLGPRRERWFTLAPTMDVQKDRASIGLTGRF